MPSELPDNLFYSALHSTAVERMTSMLNSKAPPELRPVLDIIIPIVSDGLAELIAYIVDAIQYDRIEVEVAGDAENIITIRGDSDVSEDPN